MAKQPDRGGRDRPNARARSAALREAQRKKEARQKLLTIGGIATVVVVVVAVIVVIAVTGGSKTKNATTGRSVAPAASVTQVTTVAATDTAKVDSMSAVTSPPKAVTGSALTFDGKPGIFYYGAEYCPYCAAERWPFVEALSRFGTWSGLDQTTSSASDVHPNTATFSFLNAKYSSSYISLQTVESQDNEGKTLQKATATQNSLVAKYDSNGSIPFIDFGNKWVISGATYDSTILDGKSFDEIAAAVPDPNTDIGKAVLGNANVMTAAICDMTGNTPANVCTTKTITDLQTSLKNQK